MIAAEAQRDSLPRASLIGFTGTPIEKTDANTHAVFGDLPPEALRNCSVRDAGEQESD